MKSRIRNAIPKKIIGINISSQKRDIIEDIAKSENAEAVFFDNEIMGQQVGYLCGFKGFVRSEKEGEDITDECLIFSGIDGRSLDPILKMLREKEATVKLKAIVTAHNQSWNVGELIKELRREHLHMNGATIAQRRPSLPSSSARDTFSRGSGTRSPMRCRTPTCVRPSQRRPPATSAISRR